MTRLPVLEARRDELEKCAYCPKLCRHTCPVSNAESRETVTPWGKMSMAYFNARADVPAEASFAEPAWACTGCMACRESCDHRNDVTGVLYDARSALTASGLGSGGAVATIRAFARHQARTREAVRTMIARTRRKPDGGDSRNVARSRDGASARHMADARGAGAPNGVLLGCVYARGAREVAADAFMASEGLAGRPVVALDECCGLPLRMAGDRDAFAAHAGAFQRQVAGLERVVVVDPGCGMALRHHYRDVGVRLGPQVELLVELAAKNLDTLSRVDCDERVRWHDPCQLGRGLGIYDEPRAVLERILGHAPDEFDERRERGVCSGAGGLLPATRKQTARRIADARVAAHEREGGGRIVTGCGASLLAFRKVAGHRNVDDLASWIARALRGTRPDGQANRS